MDQRSLYLLRQAFTAIFKRWRLVALVFLAIFVPFNFFNMIRQPVYSAKSKVLITKDRAYAEVSPLVRDVAATDLPNEMVVNSEIQLIQSRDLLRRLSDELATQAQADPDGAFPVPALKTLQQQVQVLRKPQSNVLEIGYRSTDPDYAIHVVNTLVGLYARYHIEAHKAPGALTFFDKETQAAKEAFVQSDLELERFDAANGLTSIATEVEDRLRQRAQLEADLRRTEAQVTELTTKVAAVEAELEYIPEQEATEVEIIPNPLLSYLRQNLARLEMERERLLQLYTPQHRLIMDVESEIAGLKSQVAGQESTVVGRKKMAATGVRRRLEEDLLASQAQVGALEARRTLLAERISDYENQIRVLHGKHYEVMRMRREREEHKTTYNALLDKLNTMKVSEAMDMAGLSNVSIIEAAAAPLESEPDYKTITLALTTFLALLLSVSAAVVFEMVNPVMNSDLDVRHHLGLPVLAAIPLNGGSGGPGNNLQGNVQGNLQGNNQGNVGNGYRVGNARRSGNRRGNNGHNGNNGNGGRRS